MSLDNKIEWLPLTVFEPTGSPLNVEAQAKLSGHALHVNFKVMGDTSTLLMTETQRPQQLLRGTELWKHTVFEFFMGPMSDEFYYEWNFSPALEWDFHAFLQYRQKNTIASLANGGILNCTSDKDKNTFILKTTIDLSFSETLLWYLNTHQPLRLGISAVLENKNFELTHFALKHLGNKPDFHNSKTWTQSLT